MRKFLRTVRFFGLASSLVVAMAVDASAALTTITFDGAPTGPDVTFQEGGYTISVSGASIQNIGSPNNNVLVDSTPTNVFGNFTTITKTGGGTFSLVSLDIANLDNPGGGVSPVGTGAGFRIEVSGGAGIDAWITGTNAFSSVFPTDITNVTSVSINIVSFAPISDTFAVDNVVLSSVPEPSSFLVAGSVGILGLGLAARRRRI